jgi:hypothetical protein
VEVPAAEAVRLVAGRLHLCSVGKCGEEKESSAARMSNNGAGELVFIAAASGARAHMARIYASPCSVATPCCAKLPPVCSYSAWEATVEWRWRIVGAVTDSGPRGESCA